MNKLIIFAAGVIAGSVIPLAIECAYLKTDLNETKSRLENAEKKLNYPPYQKHGRGPAAKKEKLSGPIGFC